MMGICGWIGPGTAGWGEEPLRRMLDACGGRGSANTWRRGGGLALAASGGSDAEERLSWNEDLSLVLSETPLGASGRRLTARDLAELYRTHGEDFLRRVRGPFALALHDRSAGRLLLAVDRAGIRPLYFRESAGGVAFASRLAGLAALPDFTPELDRQALFDYLYFHVVPAPATIYAGCGKLLPAQMLVFGDGGRRERFYWAMPYRDDNPTPFETLRDEFRALLPQVVERAAGSGDAVGAFLSGGTDSSTVAGTYTRTLGRPLRTYSMGFAAEGFDEMAYARVAAGHFGTKAREYYVTPEDVVGSIPAVAGYCDEPFGNASVVPAYLCARFAREDGIARMLAGDGGDEIFGGNARYANQWVFELYGRVPGWLRGALIEPVLSHFPAGEHLAPVRKARSYVAQARVPLPDRLETYNFLHRSPLAEIFDPAFLAAVDPERPLADLRRVYQRAASASATNRMMHLDLKITLADNDLRKVNQACGLAGVDVRYPLLDDEMLELAARVPPGMQVKRTRLRWFFKEALRDFLPAEIIGKRKHGFGLPVGLWMAEHPPFRELAEDNLAAFRRRGILNPEWLEWVRQQHAGAHASYYGVMLWVLVMLEQWLEQRGL